MVFVTPALVSAMNVPVEAHDFAVQYLSICCGGLVFIVGYNLLSCIFRGIGNSILPLVFVIIACVINVVGDIVLVSVFDMGVKGVA